MPVICAADIRIYLKLLKLLAFLVFFRVVWLPVFIVVPDLISKLSSGPRTLYSFLVFASYNNSCACERHPVNAEQVRTLHHRAALDLPVRFSLGIHGYFMGNGCMGDTKQSVTTFSPKFREIISDGFVRGFIDIRFSFVIFLQNFRCCVAQNGFHVCANLNELGCKLFSYFSTISPWMFG